MFTGIIQDLGEVIHIEDTTQGRVLWISSNLPVDNFRKGNSIAVNGVCVTVESFKENAFRCTLVKETLKITNLSNLLKGSLVNLEPPLTLQTPLAGHLVLGHVDGVGKITQRGSDFRVKVPKKLMKYIAKKASLTINGVSLTVVNFKDNEVSFALIPETLKMTNLKDAIEVNLEVDTIARYLERINGANI